MTASRAILTPYGTVFHERGSWRAEFPVEKLEAKIAFYRKMDRLYGHKSGASYRADIEALEAVLAEVQGS